jgi:Protein of unknown function (DUF4089)
LAGRQQKRPQAKRKVARARLQKQSRAQPKSKHPASALQKGKRGAGARGRPDELSDFVKASAQLLGLPIEAGWEAAVMANLAAILRLASSFADFPLPDEADPAPVFTA